MDPKSWNEVYAQKLLNGLVPRTPDLSSVQRMIGAPAPAVVTCTDANQQPPGKMPRNLGLHAAAVTPRTDVENNLAVVIGVRTDESVGGQEDCGEYKPFRVKGCFSDTFPVSQWYLDIRSSLYSCEVPFHLN